MTCERMGGRLENDEIINYYDNYQFLDSTEYKALIPAGLTTQPFTSISEKYSRGQQTGVWQLASNGESMLTIFGYDDHGRVIKKLEIGLGHNATMTETAYNFVGDVTAENVTYYAYNEASGSVSPTFHASTTNKYDIPHTKLLGSSVITIRDIANGQNMRDTISKFTYDEFGRMVANDRSGTAGDMSYAYDKLHGCLTQTTAKGGFEQTLLRETDARECRFNGSIAAMEWKCGNDIKRRYDYDYDVLNRLGYAHYSSYQADWSQTKAGASPTMRLIPGDWRNGDYSVCYNYDANSNLLEAERQGWAYVDEDGNDVYDTVDDVMIEYNGNQRKSATVCTVTDDNYYGKMTFVDGADKGVEYAYDGNGNLTRDDNKGITNIEYDLLGNPRRVTLKNNRRIEYVYAADGRKLRTIHERSYTRIITPQPGHGRLPGRRTEYICDTTDYVNNYIFKDDKPEMFRFGGGYFSFNAQGQLEDCHYYVQDYQGNNRMVVNGRTNVVEQINHYYPYGALMGDISTQPEKQSFKYSGKELDRTYGLDLYDFHARQYDPLLPGFNSVDPCATDYYWISPYVYCAGNSVNYVDPTGNFILGTDGKRVQTNGMQISRNASNDTKRLWKAVAKVETGRSAFNNLVNNPNTEVSFSISSEHKKIANNRTVFGETSYKYKIIEGKKVFTKASITIYEGSIKDKLEQINQGKSLPQVRTGMEKDLPVQTEDVVGGTAVHEATHVTDEDSNAALNPDSNNREKAPVNIETQFYKELDQLRITPNL